MCFLLENLRVNYHEVDVYFEYLSGGAVSWQKIGAGEIANVSNRSLAPQSMAVLLGICQVYINCHASPQSY